MPSANEPGPENKAVYVHHPETMWLTKADESGTWFLYTPANHISFTVCLSYTVAKPNCKDAEVNYTTKL